VLGKKSILGPGSLLAGKIVPDGEYWAGNPAQKVRDVTESDSQGIKFFRQPMFCGE
jgi:carbonic anhydrase/acetyltransferase-like protein (isoleucine patch superfamily)